MLKSKERTCYIFLLYCGLFVKVIDVIAFDESSHFGYRGPPGHQIAKQINSKHSTDFDMVKFALEESDAPMLVAKALHEDTKTNMHDLLFSSSKYKNFNTISTFVHFETSKTNNNDNVYCPVRDASCDSSTVGNMDCSEKMLAISSKNFRPDESENNNCDPVTFASHWPSPSQPGNGGWVSLWVYFSLHADECAGCCAARLPVSRTIGEKIEVPDFMTDFDLSVLDWENSYTVYLHSSTTFMSDSTDLHQVAQTLCVVEGSASVLLHPPDKTDGTASTRPHGENVETVSGAFLEQDCIMVPKSWKLEVWSAAATSILVLSWVDDFTLSEEFIQKVLEDDDNFPNTNKAEKINVAGALSLHMPVSQHSIRTVWLDEPKLPYIFSRYLFSKTSRFDLDEFVDLMKLDANVFPSLVDCPPKSECFYLLRQIFVELDFNGDGLLNETDLRFLTPAKYDQLSNELDDLIQEVIDVSRDQWEEALDARTSSATKASRWIEFANRAQEKKMQTAKNTAKRIASGDMSFEEIVTIRENLPGLYEELIAYGSIEPLD